MESDRKKGHFTFRTASVFFFVSALFEILAAGAPVPLFGEIREGFASLAYHLGYAALFATLGLGLWTAKSWGPSLVALSAALYTLDKVQLLLSEKALEAVIAQLKAELEISMPGIETALVTQTFLLLVALFILGWWGFALYTWWRREYFAPPRSSLAA